MTFELFIASVDAVVALLPEYFEDVEGPNNDGEEKVVGIERRTSCFVDAAVADPFPHGKLIKELRAISDKYQAALYCLSDGSFCFVKRQG